MAGSNMEVFRFGFYLFFPIFMMYKFGDPVWYETYVRPYRDRFIPSSESSKKPPQTPAELQAELAKYRARRQAQSSSSANQTSSSDTHTSTETISAQSSSGYDKQGSSSTTLEALAQAEAARRKPVGGVMGDIAGSGQNGALDNGGGSETGRWAWAQSSSNSGRLV